MPHFSAKTGALPRIFCKKTVKEMQIKRANLFQTKEANKMKCKIYHPVKLISTGKKAEKVKEV